MADSAGGVRAQRADLHHPMLRDARPMAPRRTMVTGCNGQLGHAIRDYVEESRLEGFEFNDIDTFDFSDPAQYDRFDWSLYGTIINAGAYTAVDRAETPEGRPVAWKATRRARPCSPGSPTSTTSPWCT